MTTSEQAILYNEFDVAKMLKVSVPTLRRWRYSHTGPPFMKLGVLVRYDPQALRKWVSAQPVDGDPQRRRPR